MKKGLGVIWVCVWLVVGFLLTFSTAHAVTTLKFGTIDSPMSALGQGITLFGKLVEEKTKGEVKINFGYSSAFGGWAALLSSVEMGSVDLMVEDIGSWEFFDPALRIVRFAYVFRDYDHYAKYLNSPVCEESKKKLLARNHHILLPNKDAVWVRGPYRVLASKKPVFTADDVKGLKLRLYESETAKKVWGQALGATITVIPWGETYLALKQGMVESVTSPLDSLYDIKFTEVCKYVTEIKEFYQNQMITINAKKWQSFSPAIQKAFNEAATEVAKTMNARLYAQVEKDMQRMTDDHGAAFIRVSTKSFQDKVKPYVDELENQNFWPKGLYGRIQEIK
ncbi:MAG TPA: TRAP transporter substrate-binding protein [Thermodesulfobacteriota bacterium]|nr:TRAP transporter substrate-binding protein [Thermodesulfobacteriota bacterium]